MVYRHEDDLNMTVIGCSEDLHKTHSTAEVGVIVISLAVRHLEINVPMLFLVAVIMFVDCDQCGETDTILLLKWWNPLC